MCKCLPPRIVDDVLPLQILTIETKVVKLKLLSLASSVPRWIVTSVRKTIRLYFFAQIHRQRYTLLIHRREVVKVEGNLFYGDRIPHLSEVRKRPTLPTQRVWRLNANIWNSWHIVVLNLEDVPSVTKVAWNARWHDRVVQPARGVCVIRRVRARGLGGRHCREKIMEVDDLARPIFGSLWLRLPFISAPPCSTLDKRVTDVSTEIFQLGVGGRARLR
jgi:hypothetical protein